MNRRTHLVTRLLVSILAVLPFVPSMKAYAAANLMYVGVNVVRPTNNSNWEAYRAEWYDSGKTEQYLSIIATKFNTVRLIVGTKHLVDPENEMDEVAYRKNLVDAMRRAQAKRLWIIVGLWPAVITPASSGGGYLMPHFDPYWDSTGQAWNRQAMRILGQLITDNGLTQNILYVDLRNEINAHLGSAYDAEWTANGGRGSIPSWAAGSFQSWLTNRYGTIANLNSAWGATYTSFAHIPVFHYATEIDGNFGSAPQVKLDHRDWVMWCGLDWIKIMRDEIKAVNPDIPVGQSTDSDGGSLTLGTTSLKTSNYFRQLEFGAEVDVMDYHTYSLSGNDQMMTALRQKYPDKLFVSGESFNDNNQVQAVNDNGGQGFLLWSPTDREVDLATGTFTAPVQTFIDQVTPYMNLVYPPVAGGPTPTPTPAPPIHAIYEAENAAVVGAAVASAYPVYSGSGYVDYQNDTGDYIEWTVPISQTGVSSLSFRYANGGTTARPLELRVNGAVVSSSLSFPSTGGWSSWSMASSQVSIPLGSARIRLTANGASGANIDFLLLSQSQNAPTPSPTQTPTLADNQTFADVPPSHPYFDEIEWLYDNGYTAGCSTNPLMYCPEATMNRAESAVFVERGIHTASYDPPIPSSQVFADMPLDSWAAKWVNGLWQDQYTAGCGINPLVYCPWQGHTRAEGSVFYLRMLHGADYEPPQPSEQTFADVPLEAWYAKWAQAAYDAGLIMACESSPEMRFCPDAPLSRGLAASMMFQVKSAPAPTPTSVPPTATPVSPTPTPTTTPSPAAGNVYHVSKKGNNSDGLSWATAWNELNKIQWSVIQPGDTILIDGGPTSCDYPVMVTDRSNEPSPAGCGMTYTTSLTIGASGTAAVPITIQMSDEPGRNGTVRIFGGRATPLGYCGQTDYVLGTANPVGIYLSGYSHIVVDGRKWGGIKIYGHNGTGIHLYHWGVQTDLTFRNIEVFDNGTFSGTGPDGAGITPVGTFLTFDRMIVHDNGQDAFQTCYVGELSNTTIKESWLFNQRPHPDKPGDVFNECTHSDGLQYCSAATSTGLLVEDSIIGPGFMQGFILGHFGTDRESRINNVSIRDTLMVSHHGDSANAGLIVPSKYYSPSRSNIPSGYVLDHITVVRDINTCVEQGQPAANCPGATWQSIGLHGSGHSVTHSIFYGGTAIEADDELPTASNNYNWRVNDANNIAIEANPMFADADFDGVYGDPTSADASFADFDFAITNAAIPPGVGSSIHKVADLLGPLAVAPAASLFPVEAPVVCYKADRPIHADGFATSAGDFLVGMPSFDIGHLLSHWAKGCSH